MTEIVLTSSVLILLLAILRQVLRGRISPCLQYALWLLAAARLLIPGTLFDAPVSVVGAAEEIQASYLMRVEAPADGPTAIPADGSDIVSVPQPADGPGVSPVIHPADGPSSPFVTRPADGPAASFSAQTPQSLQAEDLVGHIWKAGIVIAGGTMAVSNFVFYLRLRKSRKRLALPAAPWSGKLPVYETENLPSPCLFGLFQPAIYLNANSCCPAFILK